jgi:hypothetical protein
VLPTEVGTSKRGVTAGSMTLGGVSNNLDTSPMVRQELVKIRMVHGLREEYLHSIGRRAIGLSR